MPWGEGGDRVDYGPLDLFGVLSFLPDEQLLLLLLNCFSRVRLCATPAAHQATPRKSGKQPGVKGRGGGTNKRVGHGV